jgi:hypothetical protein
MERQAIIQWQLFYATRIFPIALKTYIFAVGVYTLVEEFHSVCSQLK